MKKKLIYVLLTISLGINLFLLGDWILFKQWSTPSEEEDIILSEMVQKTVESADYQDIAAKEDIIAIDQGLDRGKGGAFPYYYGVSVQTDKQTYIFSCNNPECSGMENVGTMYSIYQDGAPRLPFGE